MKCNNNNNNKKASPKKDAEKSYVDGSFNNEEDGEVEVSDENILDDNCEEGNDDSDDVNYVKVDAKNGYQDDEDDEDDDEEDDDEEDDEDDDDDDEEDDDEEDDNK